MEYTTNYHLPQWVESDRIMMGDFNEAMSNLEGGITTAQEAADAAQSAAANAQASADAAQNAADTIAENAYSPTNKPYVVGSYIGTGQQMTITLGFRPSFLIINGGVITSSLNSDELATWQIATNGNTLPECVTFTDTGFTLLKLADKQYPRLIIAERNYDYIAFK